MSYGYERNLYKSSHSRSIVIFSRGKRCNVLQEKSMCKYKPFCKSITIFFSTILGIATSFLSWVPNGFLYVGEEKFGNGGTVFLSVKTKIYSIGWGNTCTIQNYCSQERLSKRLFTWPSFSEEDQMILINHRSWLVNYFPVWEAIIIGVFRIWLTTNNFLLIAHLVSF